MVSGAVKEGLKNTFSDEKKNVKLSFNSSDLCCHRDGVCVGVGGGGGWQ